MPEDDIEDLTPNLAEATPGHELVQATLIRDVDDSEHSEEWNSVPAPTLLRDTTSGAIAVESDMAVVEAKPVEPAPAKAMSRKLICSVMSMLLLVIGALSVGFVVSAKRQRSSDSSGDGETLDSNSTKAPNSAQEYLPSASPTATPIPVLQRQGGRWTSSMWCCPWSWPLFP